jgi:polyribonucleotide 5'-hydroxyl-kinase
VFNAPPMKTSMETLSIMQNQYPERLGCAILFAPPKLFTVFWAMVTPFLDARTTAKIHFVDAATAHGQAELRKLFDLSQLDSSLGGTASQPWDFQAWGAWVSASEADAKRAEAVAAAAALHEQQQRANAAAEAAAAAA